MSEAETTEPTGSPDPASGSSSLVRIRLLLAHATQQLLGVTIGLSEEQWRAPSRLPDWSRAHLASHLARNADGLALLGSWALTGERQDPYASREARAEAIEAGSGRSGLDLQIDLDDSAGRLSAAFAALDDADRWDASIESHGVPTQARLLPLMRLFEVSVHHVDLDVGLEFDDLNEETVGWLLEFAALARQGTDDLPRLRLIADTGQVVTVGAVGETRQISGPGGLLLGWLTGRTGTDGLTGADDVTMPAFR